MRLARYFLLAGLVIAVIIIAASCHQTAHKTKKSIVVTYSILGSIVQELADGRADVTVSIPNGLDPHEWEPSAKGIETVNNADLIIQNGLGLEAGMEKCLKSARDKGVNIFTASDYIEIRHVGPGEGIPTGDPDQIIGAADPHLWTDPLMIKDIVQALVPVLKKKLGIDVADRAASLSTRLDELNVRIADAVSLIPDENRKIVTGHESMGYFAKRYGFKLTGVIIPSLSSQAAASAADLAALKEAIATNNVKAVFSELGTSPALARTVGNETGARVVELNTHALPLDRSYFTYERELADTIVKALK